MNQRLSHRVAVLIFCFVFGSLANAQLPVTDGLLLWLDASDASTVFQNSAMTVASGAGDPVAAWQDKSGNNFHAFQDDDFFQPTYESSALNGKPAIRLDGIDGDHLLVDDSLELLRPYSVFVVNQYYGDVQGRTLQSQEPEANWLHGLWSGNFGSYAEGWLANRPAELEFAYAIDTTGTESGNSTLFANGIDLGASPTPVGSPRRLGIGGGFGQYPGEVSDADISEIVIYDRVLGGAELDQVRSYIYDKWSIEAIPPPPLQNDIVHFGSIGIFTGADPGEGLDFEGTFPYAVDVGGLGGQLVGDAEFTDGSELGMADGESDGVFITDANEILSWHPAGEYGDAEGDNELELVMESIRWNVPPGLEIDVDVVEGEQYKLQLLFAESCCDRGFDVFIEGEEAVEDFNIQRLQGGINNPSQGVFFTHTFTAGDSVLNIELGGSNPAAPDNNPILNGFTLELNPGAGLLEGDFDGDGDLDADDVDALAAAVRTGNASFDLTGDGVTDRKDTIRWVEELKNTYFGDSNLDGEFNSTDFVVVFTAGEYEDATDGNSTWAEGDWDGDGDFNSSDFVIAFQGKGYELGPRPAAVPEPSMFSLCGIAVAMLAGLVRRLK